MLDSNVDGSIDDASLSSDVAGWNALYISVI
jgi:hypothetical protein